MSDNIKNKKYTPKRTLKGGESISPDLQHEPIQSVPLEVKVHNNSFDKALRAFRALVQKERILSAYKDKQAYEKPSDKRRRKRNEMKRKRLELDGNSNFTEAKKQPFKSKKDKSESSSE